MKKLSKKMRKEIAGLPSFVRRNLCDPMAENKGKISSTYKILFVDFLTQTPQNKYRGDDSENRRLKEIFTGVEVKLNSDPEWHLPDILNSIEDHSGMLVGDAAVVCIAGPSPSAPSVFEESFPSTRPGHPEGWVWHRKIRLFPNLQTA